MKDYFKFPFQVMKKNDQGKISFISAQEARHTFQNNFHNEEFLDLKLIINRSIIKFKIDTCDNKIIFPPRPAMLEFLNLSEKGCNKWASFAKKVYLNRNNIFKREKIWEDHLGTILGPPFWDMCYIRIKDINFDNKIMLLQYQILKGTLKTNKILSKFIPNISDLCSFCNNFQESILHIFWDCALVKNFLDQIFQKVGLIWKQSLSFFNRSEFLFGKREFNICTPRSVLILYIKRFIWIQKCISVNLDVVKFFTWFKKEMEIQVKAENLAFLDNRYLRDISHTIEVITTN